MPHRNIVSSPARHSLAGLALAILLAGCGGGGGEGDASLTGTGAQPGTPPSPPDPPPADVVTPSISIADLGLNEGDSGLRNAGIEVTLSEQTTRTVTITYATSAGTASPQDFQSASGTLTFSPGDTRETITVPVFGDTTDENDETVSLQLSAPVNATLARATATLTIRDDDARPTLSVIGAQVTEGDSGSTPLTLRVRLSHPSAWAVNADYYTVDRTALRDEDYSFTNGRLTIPAGQTEVSIDVPVLGDATQEGEERFDFTIENPVNATLATATASGVIQDDDTPTTLTLSWEAPVRNVDDSCANDLDGYRVRAGNDPGQYSVDEEVTLASGALSCTQTGYDSGCALPVMTCEYEFDALTAGTWYLAVQAFDQAGNYGPHSNEISAEIN
jgi:hypothetical protein